MNIQDSERLSYQLMTEEDADLLFKLDQDSDVMRYINGGRMTTMEEINNIYIPRMHSYTNQNEGWGLWKVCIKKTNQFIGWILIRPMSFFTQSPELDNLEIGWRFMKNSWGKGYATEAADNFKQAIVDKKQIRTLTAIAMRENSASVNIMHKLGMKYIKTDIHKGPLGDEEVVYYQIDVTSST